MNKTQNNDKRQLIGSKINEIRKNEGISVEKLSEMVGISVAEMKKYEAGTKFLSIVTLTKISEALRVPFEDFLPEVQLNAYERILNYSTGEKKQLRSILSEKIEQVQDPVFSRNLELALRAVDAL